MNRLQANVSRGVLRGSRERYKSVINDDTPRQVNAQTQSEDVNKAEIAQSRNDDDDSVRDIMKFKSKVIEIMPNQNDTSTAFKSKPLRHRASSGAITHGPSASVRAHSSDPSRIRTRSYHEFDDIETTLAKITSSQQTICTTLTLLM